LCGRTCDADRRGDRKGFCGEGPLLRIAWAGIHRGEEPPISGTGGSGAVFFSGCGLKCFFCQNHQISRGGAGRAVTSDEFAEICIALQSKGAENINLVTASHFIPSVAEGLLAARARGLRLPILWNSSGYESAEGLEILSSLVDIYVPDLKTLDPRLSLRLFGTPGYPEAAGNAILSMAAARPLVLRGDVLESGVIVRHLVLPGFPENTRQVLSWFAGHLTGKALISIMFQYTPSGDLPESAGPGDWNRGINEEEYNRVMAWLDEFGIEEGFVQELPPEGEAVLPDFSLVHSFPPELADVVWSHRGGFHR
jgi:putative pyruvate formate lyase activating enzyme